jgi:hypothetical protein
MKTFPLYNDVQILVDGIIATGDNALRVGAAPQPPESQDVVPSEDEGYNSTDEVCTHLSV